MTIPRIVRQNLGYALLGGPALGAVSFVVGTSLFGTTAGIGSGLAVYGLGWVLSARRSEQEPQGSTSTSDPDGDRDRREREAEAQKSGYGGGGGGG